MKDHRSSTYVYRAAAGLAAVLSLFFFGTAALAVPAASGAAAAASAAGTPTYALEHHYQVGDVSRYRVVNRVLAAGLAGEGKLSCVDSSTMQVTETVEDVRPDGSATISADLDDGTSRAHATIHRDRLGGILSTRVNSGSEAAKNLLSNAQDLVNVVFPSRPVRLNESWHTRGSMLAGQGVRMSANATLVGTEMMGDLPTLKVTVVGDGGLSGVGAARVHYTAVANFDPRTGQRLRLVATAESTSKTSRLSKVILEQTITSLDDDADQDDDNLEA